LVHTVLRVERGGGGVGKRTGLRRASGGMSIRRRAAAGRVAKAVAVRSDMESEAPSPADAEEPEGPPSWQWGGVVRARFDWMGLGLPRALLAHTPSRRNGSKLDALLPSAPSAAARRWRGEDTPKWRSSLSLVRCSRSRGCAALPRWVCTPSADVFLQPLPSQFHAQRCAFSRSTRVRSTRTGLTAKQQAEREAAYSDQKVANREIRVWHFVIENGY
jgi:hypothetical protein